MLLFVTLVDEMKDMMRRMKAGNGALITPIRLCIALLNTRRAVKWLCVKYRSKNNYSSFFVVFSEEDVNICCSEKL